MAIDLHVVGWIREHEPRLLVAHEPRERRRIASVAAEELVVAEEPQVSAPRDGRLIVALLGQPVCRVLLRLFALASMMRSISAVAKPVTSRSKWVSIEERC